MTKFQIADISKFLLHKVNSFNKKNPRKIRVLSHVLEEAANTYLVFNKVQLKGQ